MDNKYLYNSRFKGKRAEDYFSTKWFLNQADEKGISTDGDVAGVKGLSEKALNNPEVQNIFDEFGKNLAEFLNGLLSRKIINQIVFGGNRFQSFQLFDTSFKKHFTHNIDVQIVDKTSDCSLIGAAIQHHNESEDTLQKMCSSVSAVLPVQKNTEEPKGYDIYPSFSLGSGKIQTGYKSLKELICRIDSDHIVIDGNVGTLWGEVVSELNAEFIASGTVVSWYCIDAAYKAEEETASILEKYLGGDDTLFGFNYPGTLKNFFDKCCCFPGLFRLFYRSIKICDSIRNIS